MSFNKLAPVSSSSNAPKWVFLLGPCHRGPVESTREDGTVLSISKTALSSPDPLTVFETNGRLGAATRDNYGVNRAGDALFVWLHEDGRYWALVAMCIHEGMPDSFRWFHFYPSNPGQSDPSHLMAYAMNVTIPPSLDYTTCGQYGTLFDALQALMEKHPLVPKQVQAIKQKAAEVGV